MFVHQDVEERDQARSQFCVFAEAADMFVIEVELNGSGGYDILPVAWQERLNPVDQFLNGERQDKCRVCQVFVDGLFIFKDENDREFGILFADGQADAYACAS
jgi:hypothetical protein